MQVPLVGIETIQNPVQVGIAADDGESIVLPGLAQELATLEDYDNVARGRTFVEELADRHQPLLSKVLGFHEIAEPRRRLEHPAARRQSKRHEVLLAIAEAGINDDTPGRQRTRPRDVFRDGQHELGETTSREPKVERVVGLDLVAWPCARALCARALHGPRYPHAQRLRHVEAHRPGCPERNHLRATPWHTDELLGAEVAAHGGAVNRHPGAAHLLVHLQGSQPREFTHAPIIAESPCNQPVQRAVGLAQDFCTEGAIYCPSAVLWDEGSVVNVLQQRSHYAALVWPHRYGVPAKKGL
mmetsp:Transcript_101907/g.287573  ORF Transcript_101907/g.287573 Transcript_101907/m.287573 type:complete len:299 (+) Transcript_101907:2425-3321(+)